MIPLYLSMTDAGVPGENANETSGQCLDFLNAQFHARGMGKLDEQLSPKSAWLSKRLAPLHEAIKVYFMTTIAT